MPAVGELTVTVNWPDALVVPVNGPAGDGVAPFAALQVTVTDSPAAGRKPPPVSFSSVTVNVCACRTSFVADGAIEILAAAQLFTASGESPGRLSPVARVSTTPPTLTVVDAWIAVEPPVGDEITTVHDPVEPAVVQLDGPTNVADAPIEFVSEKVITVPAGAFTKPAPSPAFTFT